MTAAPGITPHKDQLFLHKEYRDEYASERIACQAVDARQLMRLAAAADCIEIRQPDGSGWVPGDLIDQLVNALRALPLLLSPLVENAGAGLQRLRLIVGDRIGRIRIRHGRHVLAGETRRWIDGRQQRVLVLVIAQKRIRSCDWHLS